MKHNYLALFFVAIITIISSVNSSAQRSNCAALPTLNTLSQPDGTSISLVGVGNEAIHYLETAEGYTVLKNANGIYEFAIPDHNGNLTTSGIKATNGILTKLDIPMHLRYSAAQQSLMQQLFDENNKTAETYGKAADPNPFPAKGNRNVLVILVEYPDLRATVSKQNFELLLNQPNYNGTGSFKDYYLATSNGQLNLTSIVYGWVMADSGYKYYGRTSSPSYNTATRQLLLGAVKDANDSFGVDFSQFDSDTDGFCDGVIIMHAGIGAEEASAPNSGDYIWSFRSTLSSTQRPTYDGVQIAAYAMFPERRWEGGANSVVGIGVLSHEFGHLLDLPDLYSTQSTNEGAGNFSLMAGGAWLNSENTPCNNDAWSRIQMGWVTPTLIKDTQLYKIPYAVVDSDMVYQINTSRPNEYYLLENRQQKKFDLYLPGRGLAIWHINTNNAYLLSKAPSTKRNNVNNDTSQLGVGLIQADGFRHLENNQGRGDNTDLYPINLNKNFAPKGNPASNLHFKVNNVKQPSGVAITDIQQLSDSSIVFEYGINASAAFNTSRTFGCAPLLINFTDNSAGGDSIQWSFGNGAFSSIARPNTTYSKTGFYNARLTVFRGGKIIDTNRVEIKVLDSPEPDYETVRDENYNVTFINKTLYGNTYNWSFTMDSTFTSTEVNPVIAAGKPRKIFVRLTVRSKDNCIKGRTDSVSVFAVGLNNTTLKQIRILAYPNPSSSAVKINFNLTSQEATQMGVYNIAGALVYEERLGVFPAGQQELHVAVNNLDAGVYFVKITTPTQSGLVKLIKQ